MSVQIIPVDPFDYIVFGATGDLALRKLFPALYMRELDGQIPDGARLIGASRRQISHSDFAGMVTLALREYLPESLQDETAMQRFAARISYVSTEVSEDSDWQALSDILQDSPNAIRAFYLSVSPQLYATICNKLASYRLITPESRVVVEKPIGRDTDTARAVNDAIGAVFDESQIYRIDHYLGKETVQNLMALRFANIYFEPIWNAQYIDHVQITAAETLGVEGRSYYDDAGAMRDMVQNHLLQLLCLIAMEPPASMEPNAVRDEKLKVLKALAPIDASNCEQLTVRGQYRAGAVDGNSVPGYLQELSKDDSRTETYVAIKAHIHNWRWAGVPFYLRTGKRLPKRVSEIVVQFRTLPHSIFGDSAGQVRANRLVIRLQPNEGVQQSLMIKDPGPGGFRFRKVALDMSFADQIEGRNPEAYERLLLDVIRGNQTLFMRRDEVEAAWAWVDPILQGWQSTRQPAAGYNAGSWGPSTGATLIARDERCWYEDRIDAD